MKFQKIIYAKEFDGMPKESDFEFIEEDLGDELNENEFFYEALYVSCDPYIRLVVGEYKVGETTIGGYQLSKIVKSKNAKYPIGMIVVMGVGWRSGGKDDGSNVWYVRDDVPKNVPLSAACGIFAMTGLTACYGVDRVLKPKPGETIFVSGAAGAVGTVVGQLGKIKGCNVIGSCGSDEKCAFIKKIGFDDAFNYKKETVDDALKRLAPNGVDCYWDNIGATFASTVLNHMNLWGRIAVCGSITGYNAKGPVMAPMVQTTMTLKSILMQGFTIFNDVPPHADELYEVLRQYATEGKLKQYEYVTEGFANVPSTFIGMLQGKNLGKTVVKM